MMFSKTPPEKLLVVVVVVAIKSKTDNKNQDTSQFENETRWPRARDRPEFGILRTVDVAHSTQA